LRLLAADVRRQNHNQKGDHENENNVASDAAAYGNLFLKNRAVANKFFAKCMGQDAAMEDETVEKLKGFLKNKLSAEDHEQVCNMLAGDVEAAEDDTEQGGTPLPLKVGDKLPSVKVGGAAADAQVDFLRRYPGLASVRTDNSGIQPRARAASYSDAAAKSFSERYPGLAHIKQL
jgi:hypothetical protein